MSKNLERMLAFHSSPALCGIKASNLISLDYSLDILKEIEELNNKYNPRICFKVLKILKNKILVLVYRKKTLQENLFKNEVIEFLNEKGYMTNSVDEMLSELSLRILGESFPHEIGVFLGYDLDDTKAFLNGEKELYVGYWKVYSGLEKKIETFNTFNRCRNCVIRLVDKGYSLENFMR